MKTSLSFLIVGLLSAVSLLAQAVAPAPVSAETPDTNLFQAMYATSIGNPASFMVIGLLCVFAWAMEVLPFIDSKYIGVYCVILGASIYWLFAFPSSVPKNFPHPAAVFISNGVICGFLAAIAHRQVTARAIAWVQSWNGGRAADPPPAGKL